MEGCQLLVRQGAIEDRQSAERALQRLTQHRAHRIAGGHREVRAASGLEGGVLRWIVGEDPFVVEVGVDAAVPVTDGGTPIAALFG